MQPRDQPLQDERGVTIVLHHSVPGDVLPSFLRSVRPEGLTIRLTETWTSSGSSVHAVVDGVPATITVVMHLTPDPAGCEPARWRRWSPTMSPS